MSASNLALKLVEDQRISRKLLIESDPNRETNPFIRRYKRESLGRVMKAIERLRMAEEYGIPTMIGCLYLKHHLNDGDIIDYGLVSTKLVTTAGVNFLVDAFQNIVELETMRYHGIGTTNTAENAADTALAAELSTVYNPDNTRATGTLAEGASANIYRTVGTNSVDGSATIVEHGVFSQAATGGGTLLDRSVFGGIGLTSGNSLQSTYELTLASGG